MDHVTETETEAATTELFASQLMTMMTSPINLQTKLLMQKEKQEKKYHEEQEEYRAY